MIFLKYKSTFILSLLILNAALADTTRMPARIKANAFLGFDSQTSMIRSFQSLRHILRELPRDIYKCTGNLVRGGWTSKLKNDAPKAMNALSLLFKERFTDLDLNRQMGFVNDHDVYIKDFEVDQGVCAGVTYENWVYSYLTLWDEAGVHWLKTHPELKLPDGQTPQTWVKLLNETREKRFAVKRSNKEVLEAEANLTKDEKLILQFYRPFIDLITMDEKVTVIPFFKDLGSFSTHPALTLALKQRALDLWYGTNVSALSILEMLVGSNARFNILEIDEINALAIKSRHYLDMGISPIIFFTLPTLKRTKSKHGKWIHVVRVRSVHYSESGDKLTIEVIDPNYLMPNSIQKIEIAGLKSEKLTAFFTDYKAEELNKNMNQVVHSLSEVEIVPWMDWKAAKMIGAWKKWFEENPDFGLNPKIGLNPKK